MLKVDILNTAYEGIPRWDIGRPQKEFVRLVEQGEIKGRVLDVGCGTGENTLYLAGLGYEVWGIDIAAAAISKAQAKAENRGINNVSFQVGDALDLRTLFKSFDTIFDAGLFHVLTDTERLQYANSLKSVLDPKGTFFMLCFNENEPGKWGPRRITQAEIRDIFRHGWKINYIQAADFESRVLARFRDRGSPPTTSETRLVPAWLSSISRIEAEAIVQ
jgi:SAM-dependent methyltransferase